MIVKKLTTIHNGKRYLVVREKGYTSYGVYLPELPGCVAVGDTYSELIRLIAAAIPLHIELSEEL